MKKEELERVKFAFRWNCQSSSICTALDKTKYVDCCFAHDCEKRNYKCDGSCKNFRNFVKMLKEPYE